MLKINDASSGSKREETEGQRLESESKGVTGLPRVKLKRTAGSDGEAREAQGRRVDGDRVVQRAESGAMSRLEVVRLNDAGCNDAARRMIANGLSYGAGDGHKLANGRLC
jgi:hypothetical protein